MLNREFFSFFSFSWVESRLEAFDTRGRGEVWRGGGEPERVLTDMDESRSGELGSEAGGGPGGDCNCDDAADEARF
jgi:hypothetical protein